MAQAKTISVGDAAALFELMGKLAETPSDLTRRREVALKGLMSLVPARVGIMATVDGLRRGAPPRSWKLVSIVEVGWSSAAERAVFHRFMDATRWRDPFLDAFVQLDDGDVVTSSRDLLVEDRDWYSSPHVHEVRKACNVDHCIYSANYLPQGMAAFIVLHRAWGDSTPFSARDRNLVQLFHTSLAWMYRADPVLSGRVAAKSLPPRLEATLEHLLTGKSEKQIAAALKLSRHTVHDYVKAIYRRYGVSTRAELLAMHLHGGASDAAK